MNWDYEGETKLKLVIKPLTLNNRIVSSGRMIPSNCKEVHVVDYTNTAPVITLEGDHVLQILKYRCNRLEDSLTSLPNARHIMLDNCGLTSLPDLPICLESLSISSNSIRELPRLDKTNIMYFQGSSNQFSEINLLPNTLISFSCSDNKSLTRFPIFPENIRKINISDCSIKTIPEDIQRFTSLESIDFRNNSISNLPDFPNNVREIYFKGNPDLSLDDYKKLFKHFNDSRLLLLLRFYDDLHKKNIESRLHELSFVNLLEFYEANKATRFREIKTKYQTLIEHSTDNLVYLKRKIGSILSLSSRLPMDIRNIIISYTGGKKISKRRKGKRSSRKQRKNKHRKTNKK